tara:strand:+ start:1085 stop:1279 length:195 start_codon:yes stop_codon:yes gene_type:complete
LYENNTELREDNMFLETSQKWKKLNKRLEEYDKLFGEQERKEYQERKELRESLEARLRAHLSSV